MHEAVVVRVATFRTTRPAFDAALRDDILPAIRRSPGAIGVFAGRQGPEEVGVRLLVSVWSSGASAEEASHADDPGMTGGPMAATTNRQLLVLPVLYWHLARPPLSTGILRLTTGRPAAMDVASYATALSGHLAALRTDGTGPTDAVFADAGGNGFVMLSSWPDWSAVEAATGASISEPLGTKRFAELTDFAVDHYELLTESGAITRLRGA